MQCCGGHGHQGGHGLAIGELMLFVEHMHEHYILPVFEALD
jgi:hypothetical protein